MNPAVPEVPTIAETEPMPDETANEEPASGETGNEVIDDLWAKLIGVWRLIDKAGLPSNEYFIYFSYDDEEKPIYYAIYGYEGDETEYATECTVVDDFNYSVTYYVPDYVPDYVPENTDEEGFFDVHDAYYEAFNYDLSDYAAGRITPTFKKMER